MEKLIFIELIGIVTLILCLHLSDSQCTWPAPFESSTWRNNARGDLVFSSTTMSGWSFTVGTGVIDEWQCVSTDQFESGGYLILRSVNTFIQFVTSHYYAYLCLQLTAITDVSYRVYVQEPKQPNLDSDRYLIHTSGDLSAVSSLCLEAYGASGSEYQVLVKSGSELSASITCPWIFLGRFDYNHSTVSGTTTCTATGDNWDMCTDKTKMAFDFSTCNTDVAYSAQSDVYCIDTVPVGGEAVVTVYTPAAVDGSNSFSFSCFALSSGLTEASVAPEYCRQSQSSTAYPVDKYGSQTGAVITVTDIYELCPTCSALDSPDGGSVAITTDGPWTIATYTCADNYALYGDTTRTCQQNNTWSGAAPSCKCIAPASPDQGSVVVSSDGSLATYSCDVGFVLTGNEVRACQTDGNAWNGTDSTCETCSAVSSPANGAVNMSQQGSTTLAEFTCDVGFTLDGEASITCLINGTWSNTSPTCALCSALSAPDLGSVTETTNGVSTSASFACVSGYQVRGSGILTCDSGGAWNGTEPTCLCATPEAPTFGAVSISSNGMSSTFTCDVGYTMDGVQTSTCLLNGSSWETTVPTCVACANLTTPGGGNFTMTTNGTVTMVTYSCMAGYNIMGEKILSCDKDGVWSQTPATCVLCETLGDPESGSVSVTTDGSTSLAMYTCGSGYVLTGTSQRTCQTDGSWNGTQPQCDCEVPSTPANGGVTVTSGLATFSCGVNYTLAGEAVSGCSNGTGWNSSIPTCVLCDTLQSPTGGSVQFVSTTGLYTQAEYTCDISYTLSGSSVVMCGTDGAWNSTATTCVECQALQTVSNGSVTMTTDGQTTTATFSCDVGFTLGEGYTSESDCGIDGSWTEETVSCTSCASLEDISSGQVTITTNGTVTMANYTCVTDYHLVGSNTRTCLPNGTWTDAMPDCVCDSPGGISNGNVSVSADGLMVTYRCDTGYTMNGASTVTCMSDGTGWSTTPPTCVACQSLPDTANGAVTLTSDGVITMATYTCNTGYSVNGTSVRSCQTDGEWTVEPPNCVSCLNLTAPSSSSFSLSYNGTSTQALFTCVTDYTVVGQALLTCQQDGSWDAETPTCVCEAPAEPANGSVSVSADGYTATYYCDTGYTLDGTSTTTCQTDGQSWIGQTPACVGCAIITSSTGGSVSLSSNGSVTQLNYSCAVGYTLTGSQTQTCGTDGQWSGESTSCTACDALSDPVSGSVTRSTNGSSTTAVYTCSTGYYLHGESNAVCSTDGTWTSPAPTCVCVPPATPTNGTMALSADNMTLTFTCDTGFILSGSSERTCQTDGSGWSGSQPSCTTCAALDMPGNGTVTLTSDGATTTAQFSCNLGFSLDGTSVLTCGADGTWGTQSQVCVGCPSVGELPSGSVDLSTNGTASVAAFTCVSGYSVVGSMVITCLTSGQWDGEVPTCLCDAPEIPASGAITLSTDGTEVSYTCAAGTTLSGLSSRFCGTDGSGWQGTDPQCVSCPAVTSPDGGTVNETSDGQHTYAKFTCELGYSINGTSTLTCTDGGSWDNSQPTCALCPTLSTPASGSLITATNTTVTTAEFSCASGYSLDSGSTLTCQSDGTWDTDPPSCVCNTPSTPANGAFELSNDSMTITFTCDTGYTLLGVATRVCQTDGSGWNEAQPSCTTCDSLDSLSGGDITTVTTGTTTQAVFSCDAGYTISGDTDLTCRSDGTWDITAPTCQVCASLSSPDGGSVAVTTEGSTSMATYTCNNGYTLSGSATLTCRTDGSWDLTAPTCTNCMSLTSPDSGTVSLATNGTTTIANFSCAAGYYISGETTIICGTDGTWNSEVPSCVCEAHAAPANGTVTLSADKQSATFSCDVGNSLVGDPTSVCATDGTGWSSEMPTCVSCPVLSSVDRGTVEIVTNGTATTSSVTCSLGSSASGSTTILCGSDGSWSDSQPSCVQCPDVSSPDHGSADLQTDGTVTVAVYSCDVGYTLSGDGSATCLTDGSWHNLPPTCVQCESLTDIQSGTIATNTSGTVTMATFSCAGGYYLSGDQTIVCQQDGTWNSSQPECICNEPSSPADGSVWISPDGMSAVFSCDVGFTVSGDVNNVCTTNGTGWLYSNPTCVQCQLAVSLLNGNASLYTDGTATYSVYTCQEGYSLSSSVAIATCGDSGQWDQSSLSCVQCSTLTAPTSGSVQISTSGSSSQATYSCDQGYSLQGNGQRTCMTDGTWNGTDPTCVCNSPAAPSNGNVTVSSDQLTATYTCDTGYTLDGTSVRQCAEDGTGWTETSPTCVICETLTTVSGGSVSLSSDGQSTTAQVTCDTSYTMVGSSSLHCRSDGTWNVSTPQCALCDSLTMSSTGSYSLSTDGETTSVTFECGTGYSLSGTSTATCTTAGTWTQTQPTCVSCASLADPESGTVTLGSNGTTTSATFQCVDGYHIVGKSVLYCGDSGSWSTQEPTCVCDEPLAPSNGTVALQDGGYTAVYTCIEGYSLSGSTTRTCSTSGAGWNETEPTCVPCDELNPPSNGTLVSSTDGTTTSISVGCDVGYTVTGSVTLTCQSDGTYDTTVPECVECSALQSPSNGRAVLSSTGSVTMATFSCDLEYSLAGNQALTCLANGSWSGMVPACEQCASFQDISSGWSNLTTNGTTTTATVQCVTGYYLQGPDTVYCTQTGEWTEIPTCLCEDPAAPTNGQVSANGVQATFTCDEGYTISGDMSSMCLSGVSGWDKTTPSCVVCESQSAIDGGTSQTSTNGSTTSITYACPVGYTLNGEPDATCDSDGKWSTTVPSCSQCEALETPDSGSVTMETDNTTTTATYSCVSGYDLIGVSVHTCSADGAWSHSSPTCACSEPEAPLNGNVFVSSDRTTASYSCTAGYTLSGVFTRSCQTGGAGWTGDPPTCTVCSILSTPSGGNVVMATEGTMTTATFSCSAGYTMDGERTLACRDDGSWNISTPSCVLCDSQSAVSGGDYSLSTDGQITTVKYSCNKGYTLTGSTQLTCLTSGQWNGQAPVCTSCPSLSAPDSGQVETSTNGTITTATFTCMAGYYLTAPSSLTCLTSGEWDNEAPECLCELPSNVTSGSYTVSEDATAVTYTCQEGFTLDGSLSRTCQQTGLGWTGSRPTCVQCQDLSSINGGASVTVSNGSVTTTTFQCDVGATLYGESSSECTGSGEWSYEVPTCVGCPELVAPGNGNVSMATNGTVTMGTYICDVGYTMDGTERVNCQTDGSWSSDQPACILCQTLGFVESGSVSLTTDGATTIATYSCVTEYQLSGATVLTCRTDGTWDTASPTCVCTPPLSLVNGNYTISADGMMLTYSCDTGYSMTGSPDRSCDTSGAGWTGSPPTCVQCESLPEPDNGAVSYDTDGVSTVVMYSCGTGYAVSDTSAVTATCTEEGTWNTSTNTPVACVSCSVLDTIANGNITLETDGTYTIASYECLPDYSLNGNQQRTCVQGEWNGTDPTCLCSYSTFFQNGHVTSNGSIISYTCDSGYTLVGTSSRVCQDSGLGWSLTEPTCVVCETLSVPAGGNMTLATDGLETMATFSCDLGYTMSGQSELTCRTDGTWNASPPSCGSSCSALSQPSGGTVAIETNGQVTTAVFTCNVKYTLAGVTTLTCRNDGSWDFTEPSCVLCGDLSPPASGYVAMSTDGATSVANYSCHADYYLDGSSQVSCQTSGSWSSDPPTCICNALSPVANGSIQLSGDGMTATFTCLEGFTLNGNSSTTCKTDYTGWSPYTVQCVTCGNVPELSNRTGVFTTDGQVSTVSFTCDLGYTISGETSVSCTDSGSWDTNFPDCVSCSILESIQNGSYSLASDGTTTTAQFTCDSGFSLKGDNLLTCSSDGSWSASLPECVSCPYIDPPSSGSRFESTDGTTTVVSLTCDGGYHLVGDTTLACQTDGTWNGSQPLCVCDIPAAPANGTVSVSSGGMTATYTCNTGFTLYGQIGRECSNSSSGWMGNAPSCVQCEELSSLGDGGYTLSSDGTATVVTYTCQSGYTVSGPTQVTCDTDGTWDVSAPTCVSCDALDDPANGNVTIATNGSASTAEYTCDTGYDLQGQTVRSCSDTGNWNGEPPLCLCESPVRPVNGEVSSDGATATYTCDVGYTLYGEPVRSCQDNSLGWNGSQPTCNTCTSLSAVSGGSVSMVTDGTVTSAVYTCSEGYTVSGSSTISCRSDGTWDFTDTSCVSCQTLSVPSHGAITLHSDGATTTANISCDTGYTMSGTSQLSCRADGSWDFTVPSCVVCPTLQDPANGYVNISTNGLASVAEYTCVSGYQSNGGTTRTCDTEGAWSGVEPTCRCDSPVTPDNGSLVLSEDERVATFTCDTGYSLVGPSVLECLSDGTGWNGTEPTCASCNAFDPTFNGTVTLTTDGQTTMAVLTCDLGSTLTGSSSIACQEDSTWLVESALSCVTCADLSDPAGGSVTLETNGTETVANFSCDVGYTMDGEASVYCTDTGEWSGGVPSCVSCSAITSPTSGSLSQSTNGYSTVATVTCTAGYHVVGSNPVTCLVDGTWSDDVPSCVCDPPASPASGQYVTLSNGDVTQFSCEVGFTLDGTVSATCGTDGSGWDNSVPDCVTCAPLANISDGLVTMTTNGSTSLASYSCDSGFSLHGDIDRECTVTGTWTSSEPECVQCPSLSAPDSGFVNLTTNGTISTAYYSCESGYNLQGEDQQQCQTDGTWTSSQPACVCQLPAAPDNGAVTFGSELSVAEYSCIVGYTLRGTSQRHCQSDGSGWNSSAPTCVTCATLASTAGTISTPSTDGTTSSVQYSCDLGYTMVGSANLTCRDDGTWDKQAPTCVTCATLSSPTGGEVTLTTDGSKTEANVTCDKGYTISGATLLTCRSDGTWDFSVPTCVQCPSLSSPFGGSITMATDGHTTTAIYGCLSAYYLDGASDLTCGESGNWSDEEPLCKCNPPLAISDGGYQISADGYSVTYTCDSEYSLSGDSNHSCLDGGAGWSGDPPTCSQCDPLSTPSNGSYTVTTDGQATSVTYTCDTGSTISGQSEFQCQADGSWQFEAPVCVQCPSLDTPGNGLGEFGTNGTISEAVFACDLGYTLQGDPVLTCQDDGTWSSSSPTCVSCPTLTSPNNGAVVMETSGTATMANYSCDAGYSLVGSQQLTCTTAGSWDTNVPTCECDSFEDPANGNMVVANNGTTVQYSCDTGYTLVGEAEQSCNTPDTGNTTSAPSCVTCTTLSDVPGSTITMATDGTTTYATVQCDTGYSVSGQTNLTCRSDGTWDFDLPTCVTCATLSSPTGGEVTLTTDGSKTKANVTCDNGYTISGATLLTCRSDGTWDFNVPTCVQCPGLSNTVGGSVTTATDGHTTTATYDCLSAYYLDGASLLTCEESGNWSDEEPLCKCNPPPVLSDGAYQISVDGYSVTYTCDSGYSLSGDSNHSCLDGGAGWSGDTPTCSQCDPLSTPTNGSYTVTTDGQMTSVTYTCDTGSTISGQSEFQCQADGSWQFEAPVCVHCASLDNPGSGLGEFGTNGTVSEAVFTCDLGYTLQGESVLTCQDDGTWSSSSPTCVTCPTLTSPNNGAVVLETSGTVTMANYSCDAGYSLVGSQQLTCTTAGSWDTSVPTCVCDSFVDPANGNMVVANNGTTVQYSCDTGYTLVGEAEQTCNAPDTYNKTSAPSCVACTTLSDVPGSTITMATDGTTTYATVQCDTGYSISGQTDLTCRSDGTWDFDLPTCVVCDTLAVPEGGEVVSGSVDSVTVSNITCDVGYTLKGAPSLTCRTDGSWDYTVPTCSMCPSVTDPSSGSVTLSTDGHVTNASYTCVDGYYLDGASTAACNTSGLWESDPPTCKCVAPPEIENGTATVSADGSTVQYSCELGLSMDGNEARSCDTNGNWWDGEQPLCVQCEEISSQANGTVTMATDGVTTATSFFCNQGFTLNGAAVLSCRPNGTWDDDQPSCDYCSELDPPANGTLTYQTNTTMTTAQIQCDTGFSATGSTEIMCLAGGSWDTPVPTCVHCPVLGSPANGGVVMSTNGSVTTATYSCVSDFVLDGSEQLSCSPDGAWSGEPPTCECVAFVQPASGSIVVSDNGTVASYSCEAGYSLDGDGSEECGPVATFVQPTCVRCETLTSSGGSSYTFSTNGSVTMATYICNTGYTMIGQSTISCRSDGSWDREAPSCVTCSTLAIPVGASVNFTSSGEVTLAQFTCENGYSLVGSQTLTCRTDGSWDVSVPACIQCPALSNPSAGLVAMTTDGFTTVADYTCVSGYYLDGAVNVTCNSSGFWDSDPPTCKCSVAESFANGSIEVSGDGYSILYKCSLGYTLSGTANRSCGNQGTGWLGEEPVCVACGDLSLSTNLSVVQDTDGVQTAATFSCDTGYSMLGVPESTCLPDGTWSEEVPSCVQCPAFEMLTNGSVTQTSNGTNTITSYQCEEGFTLAGETTLTCDSSGAWSSVVPDCVSCTNPADITNGQVIRSTNGTVTMATYACDSGYSIVGYPELLCTMAGSWDHSEPECVCDDFTAVSNGMLSVSDNGTMATYTCDEGYTLSGEAVLTCTTPASTETVTAPACISCEALDVPSGSTVNVTTDGQTTTATVGCGVGYVMDGQASLTCRPDGTWNVVMPTCVVCSTLNTVVGGAVAMETDGSITVAKFTCDPGYTLSGSDQLTCRADGSWDLTEPTCVACPDIDDPNAGTMNLSTSGYVSMATFTCSTGYYLDGSETLTCLESGNWNGTTPVCKCDQLSSISSGNVSIISEGLLAVYSCQLGYSLSGAINRSCDQTGAGWLGEAPSCVKCEDISASNNMTVTMTTNGSISMVTYECDLGFSLNGEANMLCGTDGSWTEQQPTCDICAEIVAPANGEIVLETSGTVTQAGFTCDLDYTLNGETVATCQAGGSWSADPPHCELCPSLTDPSNGQVTMTTNGTVTLATFSCSSGYSITGDQLLYCGNNSLWSSSPPTCTCDAFVEPANGNVSVSTDGTTVSYTCDRGYALKGDATQTCTTATAAAQCVLCETLPTSSGANIQLSTDGSLTTATFSCDTGYKMLGEHVLTCRTDGTWDMEPPTCVVCMTLESPSGGTVNLYGDGVDTEALYSCVPGFTLNGQHNLTCKTDSTWDFQEPTCVCDMPSTPANGQLTVSEDSLTAVYACDVGYSMVGDSVLYCATNGNGWQGTEPSCVACPAITVANSVNVTLTSDGITTATRVLCDHGYTLSDTSNITCLQNGSWSSDIPTCVVCPSLAVTGGLTFQLQSDGLSTAADFSCASGYSINGASQITCSRNGSWDMSQPTCVAEACDAVDGGGGAGTAVAIVFALLFAIAVLLLLLLAWRFWKLREKLNTANKSNLYKTATKPGADGRTSMMSLPELDEIIMTNAKAPLSHSRHVTDMGRAASSLAPMSHHKHVHSSASTVSSSPLLLSHKGLAMPRPPTNQTWRSSPNPSFAFSESLDSKFSSPLPMQIVTPRSDLESEQSLSVPKINIDTMLSNRLSPSSVIKSANKRTSKSSRASEVADIHREGSPLPQQILTPRDPEPPRKASPYSRKRKDGAVKHSNLTTAASLAARTKSRSVSPSFQTLAADSMKDSLSDC